jgi:methionyl aminopeptidase
MIRTSDYDNLRYAGQINGQILAALRDALRPGIRTIELDEIARQMQRDAGAEAPFLGYPAGGEHPYPATINVSVNEELVHGIPGQRVIREGDVVTLDCGTQYNGLIADSAITVAVGEVSSQVRQLIEGTETALDIATKIAGPGRYVGDVAFAIQSVLYKYSVTIPPQFGGHGVGYSLHESPHMPNWGTPGKGPMLRVGMALAIEPMGMLGRQETRLLDDHWTVVSNDGSICSHFEHTILITENGAEILTPVPQTEVTLDG